MQVTLVHHGDAVGPDVDVRRPLSLVGRAEVDRLARLAATRGVKPTAVWHSGKLRAKQTAESFWRHCNALAPLSATRDLQPGDPPTWIRDRLKEEAIEPDDASVGSNLSILIVGHFPHLPRLLTLLITGAETGTLPFPQHGIVQLQTSDEGKTWEEVWRS